MGLSVLINCNSDILNDPNRRPDPEIVVLRQYDTLPLHYDNKIKVIFTKITVTSKTLISI